MDVLVTRYISGYHSNKDTNVAKFSHTKVFRHINT